MHLPDFHINDKWILSQRGPKNEVNPHEPYAFLVEKERMPNGKIEDVAAIFLTNKACPFRCLMCDLWKNTTDSRVPLGAITQQIDYALERLPTVKHIKLYNSGNFFDQKAIPPEDLGEIAQQLVSFDTVVVENHPKLIGEEVLRFQDILKPELQVAIGLETIHPTVLSLLNKSMTAEDFSSSVKFLNKNNILSRSFILLRPPFLTESEGIDWAKKSIDFAFKSGVECCTIIPTRSGNGAMDILEKKGLFVAPQIESLENVLNYGIQLNKGRVFADLWDLLAFSQCQSCYDERKVRLARMNLHQIILPEVICHCAQLK